MLVYKIDFYSLGFSSTTPNLKKTTTKRKHVALLHVLHSRFFFFFVAFFTLSHESTSTTLRPNWPKKGYIIHEIHVIFKNIGLRNHRECCSNVQFM